MVLRSHATQHVLHFPFSHEGGARVATEDGVLVFTVTR